MTLPACEACTEHTETEPHSAGVPCHWLPSASAVVNTLTFTCALPQTLSRIVLHCFIETRPLSIVQVSLERTILLPQPSESWDNRFEPPHQARCYYSTYFR